MQEAHRFDRDQRRLLRGLCDHAISRRERGGELAGENRDREIPRADAGDEPERAVRRIVEVARDFRAVIAQEVDGLAHVAERVRQRLAGFAADQPGKPRRIGFKQRGRAGEDLRAIGRGPRRPFRRRAQRRRSQAASTSAAPASTTPPTTSRVSAGLRISRAAALAACACGREARLQGFAEFRQMGFVAEIEPRGIRAFGLEEIARQRDARMRRADRRQRARRRDGVLDQRLDGNLRVGDAIDERGVGAVLQQPAHEIGEQRVVRADRRIDAARPIGRRSGCRAARPCRAGTGTRIARNRNCRPPSHAPSRR